MYTSENVCLYVRVSVCTRLYMYVHMCVNVCARVHMCICTHVCMCIVYVCLSAYVHTCMHVCACECEYRSVCARVCTGTLSVSPPPSTL